MVRTVGATHYTPISWDDAFALIASELKDLPTPDDAMFYTSGRASNEAAFIYQLFVRAFGTNNLPDCSNMCHESSGAALNASIGVGKGTVQLEDFDQAEAIFILGQNPGTNHPRMLSALQSAAQNGCQIVAVNPLKEAGLIGFAHPQEISGILGKPVSLATQYLQIRINGDQAFLQGLAKALLAFDASAPGTVLDKDFIAHHTAGFDAWHDTIEKVSWDAVENQSGLSREEIEDAAKVLAKSKKTIFCWAMGLTQHANAVATIQEVVNLLLAQGNLGKPGAGVCPVRGHSNVQGDRTMGIWEKMPDSFLDALGKEFNFEAPRHHGVDTVAAIRAMANETGKVFFALGGNFLSATPDTHYTAQALKNCRLTAQVSTKLNRSHLITGETALILPCLGRSEHDEQAGGPQSVTMENSMGIVHRSKGKLTPASPDLRSEVSIICGLAASTVGDDIPWESFCDNYDAIRERIARVIPGCENYNQRVQVDGGFTLYNAARELDFSKLGGQALFHSHALAPIDIPEGKLLLMTIRSHDQFNTTIYGLDDRYRGIKNERRVLFLNTDDMAERGITTEQPVDITSHFDGKERQAHLFLAIPYDLPRGCAAAYFPETNVLVPIESTAKESHTPTSKSIIISVSPSKA